MNLIFETIYGWFVSIYGQDLDQFLLGGVCDGDSISEWTGRFLYTPIGMVTLAIAAIIFVVYYYVINSSKWNKPWHWLLVMLLVGIINLFVGYAWTSSELPNIGECLNVVEVDCWLFGLANLLVSWLFFIVLTIAFKWWSSSCRRTPF